MATTNGISCGSGKIHHGTKKSGRGRVAHGMATSGGGVSGHAGQTPKIKNSVMHDMKILKKSKSFGPSNHTVHVKGKGFSGKPLG